MLCKEGIVLNFTHLRIHSEFSLLAGACRIQPLVSRAKELGFRSLAITDKNVMYGTIPFYKACVQAGIKPIIGLEAQVMTGAEQQGRSYPLVLLAKNEAGYRNLLKVSTYIQSQQGRKIEAIPISVLADYTEGVYGLSAGIDGEIGQCLLHEEYDFARSLAEKLQQTFEKHHFFLEITDRGLQEEKRLNEVTFSLAEKLGIPLVGTNNVSYVTQREVIAYEALRAIKDGSTINRDTNDQSFLKPAGEMADAFPKKWHHALEMSGKIAESCEVTLTLGKYVLPKYPLREGITAGEALRKLCMRGAEERFSTISQQVKDRLDYELKVINDMNFNDYFLIVWDFMKFARERNILTGPGRGSAAGSLVAYVLFITNVNPLKHDLLFERFLNPERISMPDIDIDFADTKRDEVIRYVSKKYGNEHVAQIITFGTLAARAAVRDAGKVLGVEASEIEKVARAIPTKPGMTLKKALTSSTSLATLLRQSEPARKTVKLARMIEGFPRHTSTHAAGVVISDEPLTDVVALKGGQDDLPLTQFPMEDLEDIGLLKMDFLGLRNLTLIENILDYIKKSTGRNIVLDQIPYDDQKTFSLLGKGDTTGIFQLESAGMRNVLSKLKPNEFEDIVAVNALYRPGPMDNIPTYIATKHGKQRATYPHPDLKPILEKTYGVIVYQEQIMQITSRMAGFSLGEADLLRRAISKKNRAVLEQERDHFVKGCLKKGYDEKLAMSIYDLLVRFADYGFNRSHAVAYSMIAYQLAYLKANEPLAFFTALLSSVIGNDEKLADYIKEARQKEIAIQPPSINESEATFTVKDGTIQFGLLAIKQVGVQAVRELIQNRQASGKFTDLFDLCARIPVHVMNRRAYEALILSGACDEFAVDRGTLLATLDDAIEIAEKEQKNKDQVGLFNRTERDHTYIDVPPFTSLEKLTHEKEVLGFYLSGHPLSEYESLLEQIRVNKLAIFKKKHVKQKVRIAVLVEHVRLIKTKKGEQMAFLKVSDDTGNAEIVVFPNVYREVRKSLTAEALLYIDGKQEYQEDGTVKIIANQLTNLETLRKQATTVILLKIDPQLQNNQMTQLQQVLKKHPGDKSVQLYYETEKRIRHLSKQYSISGSEVCLQEIKQILGNKNVILRTVFEFSEIKA